MIDEFREILWADVKDICPIPFVECIEVMSFNDRCIFILNGFNVHYIREWKHIYDCMSNFIYRMSVHYDKLVQEAKKV